MKILMTTCGGFVREMESWSERLLAAELACRGHEIEALTSSSVMKAFPSAKKFEIIDGIETRRFNPFSPSSLMHMLKNDYDIIHAHFPGYMAPISSWAALRKKIKDVPLVHTVHGIYHDPYLVKNEDPSLGVNYKNIQKKFPVRPWRMPNWFCHLPLFAADIILPQNNYEFKELEKLGVPPEKMEIIPTSGIDMKKYKKLPKKGSFKEKFGINGSIILFVGQASERKGPEYLIKAMPEINKNAKHAKLVFAGYRTDEKLEQMCKNLGIRAEFLGFLPEEDKIAAYADASVYCLPSLYEGFGLTYLEAMACGTPIVTTSVAGVPELVENGKNGLLVEPKNHIALAKAIARILEDESLAKKIGRNNRKTAINYDWKKIAGKIEAVYASMI